MTARQLWASAALAHIADLWSTAIGHGTGPIAEQHPLAAGALAGGGVKALVALKLVFFLAAGAVWVAGRQAWPSLSWVVPATASLAGILFASWNTALILAVSAGVVG
jgi:hypothetical protein